nr:ORF113 [Acipenserid herpesvirus 1]
MQLIIVCLVTLVALVSSHAISKTQIFEVKAQTGQPIIIPCHLTFNPQYVAKYVWQKRDWYGPRYTKYNSFGFSPFGKRRVVLMSGNPKKRPIILTNDYTITTRQEIKIESVTKQHGGLYSCLTIDHQGKFNQSFIRIKVFGTFDPPKIDILSTEHNSSSGDIIYHLKCSSKGGYPWNSANLNWADGQFATETLRGPDGMFTWVKVIVKNGQVVKPICILTHAYTSQGANTHVVLSNGIFYIWLHLSCVFAFIFYILWSFVKQLHNCKQRRDYKYQPMLF